MIKKERLEELIEQGAAIYRAYADVCVEEFKLNKDYKVSTAYLWKKMKHSAFKGCGYPLDQLFETKEEAEWVAKIHTSRTEYFEPPFELKDNEKYKFTTAKGGKMSISKFVYKSGEVQWWLSYVGTHRTFYSYQEAVEYARKLFKGENV